MIIDNVYTERAKLIIESNSKKNVIYKYSFAELMDATEANNNQMYGYTDEAKSKKGKLPISYMLDKLLTDSCGEISLSGTTMKDEKSGVNRQDYLNSLKGNNILSNNILYLKHELDNIYDSLAISIRTIDDQGNELNLGYLPRYRPHKKTSNFNEDPGTVSNIQKTIAKDQEQDDRNQQYIITNYKVTGGYSGKHYGLMVYLGKKKLLPLNLEAKQ